MKIAHISYTLECKHTAVTNIPENASLKAYHKGDSIVCPQCRYQKRKIIEESKSIGELT